jgi:hypothetical protein
MIPKSGNRLSDKIMRQKKARYFSIGKPTMLPHSVHEPS